MKSIGADIIAINEPNLNLRHPYIRRLFFQHQRQVWEHSKFSFSSSNIDTGLQKPGGTILGITGNLTSRVIESTADNMGRWSSLTLLGRLRAKITVVCTYQVVDTRGPSGPTTAFTQQLLMLKRQHRDNQRPRKEYQNDLRSFLESKINDDHEIVLCGDLNEELGSSAGGMTQLASDLGLIDIHTRELGLDNEVATYARGTKRLDYILMTEQIASHTSSCGAEPFNHRFYSDHRGIWVDLELLGLFDRNLPPLARPQFRDIRSGRPKLVRKYIAELGKYLVSHDIPDKVSSLSNRDDNLAEALDEEITTGMKAAGKSCETAKRLPRSGKLHIAQTTLRIYQQLLSQMRTQRDMSAQILKRQNQLPSPISLPTTILATNSHLRAAQREVRSLSRIAFDLRKQQKEDSANAISLAEPGTSKEKALQRVKRAQLTKEMFARLPSIKPKTSGGISMVKIPVDKPDNPKEALVWKTVTDANEVESAILERQQLHFSQAKATPFACPPLTEVFNWSGTSASAELVLNNQYAPSHDVESQTNKLLKCCYRKLPEPSPEITLPAMKQRYKHWTEGTSTSCLSGRHLGHKHALLKPIGLDPKSPEFTELDDLRKTIWTVHHGMLNYGLRNGYCYSRWKNVVTTLIEKDPGDPRIHRLRVIHLYEDCYNLLLGLSYRNALHRAEDSHVLNEGNYGSRPCRSSLDPVGLEMLQTEYSFLTRLSHLKFSNDAAACFDRIVQSLSAIVSRSFSIPNEVTRIQGDMLENALYYIKTLLGVSTRYYSHSADFRVDGLGQGSAASDRAWGFNSSTYFDLQDRLSHGATYFSADGLNCIRICMTGFVDDNNLQTVENAFHHDTNTDSLVARMNHDAQLWNDTLWTSGGALALSKCQYHLMEWMFTISGKPVLRHGKHGDPVQLRALDGSVTPIKQLSVSESYKTLGTHREPAQSQRQQFRELLDKSKKHSRLLSLSACNPHHTWVYYFSVFLRSVGYPLPVSHLSLADLEAIQRPMIPIVLTKMNYCRNLSRKLVFLSSFFGGLDFRHLYIEQGTGQINFLIRHLRTPGQVHDLLLIVLSWLQNCAGVSYPVLEHPSHPLPHLEGHWLVSLRQFLSFINASLEIPCVNIPPLQRSNDFYLMETALNSNRFTAPEICKVNLCRLFLGATSVSDISNARGSHLISGISNGEPTASPSLPKGPMVKQERPDQSAWSLWRRLLRLFSDNHNKLHKRLRSWTTSGECLRRSWPFLYSPSLHMLYRRYHDSFEACPELRRNTFDFHPLETTPYLPVDSIPVDSTVGSDGWSTSDTDTAATNHTEETITFHLEFSDYVANLPDYDAMLLQRVNFHSKSPHQLYQTLLLAKSLLLVSDGGADDDIGSTGWVIADSLGNRFVSGSSSVPGFDPRSYRAEGYAMVSGLTFLHHLCLFCNHLNQLPVNKLYCDNLGLVRKLNYFFTYRLAPVKCVLHSEYDVLAQSFLLLQAYSATPKILHVKGHQDDKTPYEFLSLPAQLNCDADKLATTELRTLPNLIRRVPLFPSAKVQLLIAGQSVTRNLPNCIRRSFGYHQLLKYCARFKWTKSTVDSINWDDFSAAFRNCYSQRNFAFKFCFRLLPTGKILYRRETRFDHRCPACNAPQECNHHLFQCPAHSRQRWRHSTTSTLRKRLEPSTDPVLSDIMIAGIVSYFQSTTLDRSEFEHHGSSYINLIQLQDTIGWDHFLRGKLSKEWASLQQDYIYRTKPNSKFDRAKWLRQIIKPLILNCHDLWTLRNEERHGHDSASKQQKLAEQVHRDLRAIYSLEDEVLASDRDLFSTPLDDFLAEPTYSIQCWLRSHKPIIYHSRREARRRCVSEVRLLPTYFHPLPSRRTQRNPRNRPVTTVTPPLRITRISDHYANIPSTATIPRSILQTRALVRHFQQLPLTFPDAPT